MGFFRSPFCRILSVVLALMIKIGAACHLKRPSAPDEELRLTSSLVPIPRSEFRTLSQKRKATHPLARALGRTIEFRKASPRYTEFKYYNVARALFKETLARDLFEPTEIAGKRAKLGELHELPSDSENHYIAWTFESDPTAGGWLIVDAAEPNLENIYFPDDAARARSLIGKSAWKEPTIDLDPLEGDGAPLEGLWPITILSMTTEIENESAEACGIIIRIRAGDRELTTCYDPAAFFVDSPQTRYSSIPKEDWPIIEKHEIAKGMSTEALILSWGSPDHQESANETSERWLYGRDSVLIENNRIVDW